MYIPVAEDTLRSTLTRLKGEAPTTARRVKTSTRTWVAEIEAIFIYGKYKWVEEIEASSDSKCS